MSHRPMVSALALLLVTVPLAGCDGLLKKIRGDKSGEAPTSGSGSEGEADPAKGKPSAGCAIPTEVEADVTVKKGCSFVLKHSVTVKNGATLRIEPGVKISVDQGDYIWIEDGKMVAKGTAAEPITFTSANKTQAAGDWVGLGFEDKTQAGTELDFVVIDYAGSATANGRGAIDIKDQSSPKRISISNTSITNSAQAAVVNDSEKGGFAKFEKNTFKKNKESLDAHSHVLGTVGAGNVFTDPLVAHGNVTQNTTWPAFDAPVIGKEHIEIGGEKTGATLTLAPKTIVKMSGGSYISVGTANGGSLVANGVTFTSANGTPHPGDWVGFFIYERVSTLQLDGAVIEYAGADTVNGRGAITFYDIAAKSVRGAKITNVTFRKNGQAAMASTDNDCAPFVATNKSEGAPLCHPAD